MLLVTTLFTLLSNAVTLRRDKTILYSRVAITILVCCYMLGLANYYLGFYGKGLGIYSGLLQNSDISLSFHLFVFIITAVILLLNGFYPRKVWTEDYSSFLKICFHNLNYYNSFILNKMSEQYKILEYSLIILFVVMGGILLMSSSDLITIFLAIELQSYGLYILCVVYRNSEGATAGGLTYFLLGGLSSCFILLASGLIYGNSGNTDFDGLYVINNITSAGQQPLIDVKLENIVSKSLIVLYDNSYLSYCLVIMSVGLLFKIGAAPFHFWSPDVYDAIPTVVTTFVSSFAKISVLILLLELVHYTSNLVMTPQDIIEQNNNINNFSWTFALLVSSLLSLIIGSVVGLTQIRIKRLFAYSTISHLGFILLALSVNSIESIQSFVFYLIQYSITNINAFFLLIAVGYSLYMYIDNNLSNDKVKSSQYDSENTDVKHSPIQLISQLKGYFYINPYIALSLAITLFSFVGIPPLAGFFAKQMVLSSALDKGYIFMVLVAILTSAISAYYYLAIVKQMYFNKTDYMFNPVLADKNYQAYISNSSSRENIVFSAGNIKLSGSISITISIFTLGLLLFILAPEECLNLATILALTLFNN